MPNVKKCRFCLETGHTQFYCKKKPRAPIIQKAPPLRYGRIVKRTPLKKVGKYTQMWIECRNEWIKKFGAEGHQCHYCGILLSNNEFLLEDNLAQKLTLDHLDARSRDPGARYEFDNLVPACGYHNKLKGSLNHDEYKHSCHSSLPYRGVRPKVPYSAPFRGELPSLTVG